MLSLGIPNMNCGGCARSVTAAIRAIDADAQVEPELAARTIAVETTVPEAAVRARLAETGVPMEEIAQYLGHSSVQTTREIYARFSPTHPRRAAPVLSFGRIRKVQ